MSTETTIDSIVPEDSQIKTNQENLTAPDGSAAAKIPKLDEQVEITKKVGRTNSFKKKKPDEELIEQAKALCGGELDTTEGRRLRKRIEPPKVEEKKKALPRRNSRKGAKVEENGEKEEPSVDSEEKVEGKKQEEAKNELENKTTKENGTSEDNETLDTAEISDVTSPKKSIETKDQHSTSQKNGEANVISQPIEINNDKEVVASINVVESVKELNDLAPTENSAVPQDSTQTI